MPLEIKRVTCFLFIVASDHSFSLPLLKLVLQMILQLLELIAKIPATSPALHIALQVALSLCVPPGIILRQREIIQIYQERRIERVVVFPVLDTFGVHISREYVDVQVAHTRHGVNTAHDFLLPVSSRGELASRCIVLAVKGGFSRSLSATRRPDFCPQLLCRQLLQSRSLSSHFCQEIWVRKGIEGVLKIALI